jgi:hypothetical protein
VFSQSPDPVGNGLFQKKERNMDHSWLTEKVKEYLDTLCNQIPNRRVGSDGNYLATMFFAKTIKSFVFDVDCPEFKCMDWQRFDHSLLR